MNIQTKAKKVTIYSTPTCPYCTYAKEYFKESGIAFEDVNVGIDRTRAQEMITKSGQMGVPVIDIDGTIVVGFQPEVFEKLISA